MCDVDALTALQTRLGVAFHDIALLRQALRHRSATLDSPRDSNERLEFLGDTVVGMVVCRELFEKFPASSEGALAKAKAFLVSETTLADAGRELGLDQCVELGLAEAAAGGRERRSILADAFEAIVAAVFLDRGLASARKVVRRALRDAFRQVASESYYRDFKSLLQERTQAESRTTPHYRIASETGADHDRTFVAQAVLGTSTIGEGTGKSKKEAEQAAAENALATRYRRQAV